MNYAAAVVLEIRQASDGSEPVIRFQYKNGTEDVLHNYPLSFPGWNGTGDVPVSTFINAFQPAAINNTQSWCTLCAQYQQRECNELFPSNVTVPVIVLSPHQKITPVGAGFLGAGLTAAVMLAGLAAFLALGLLSFGRTIQRLRKRRYGDTELSSEVRPSLRLTRRVLTARV